MRYAALAAIIALGAAAAGPALAYSTALCVGEPLRWEEPTIDLEIMPCSAPRGSNRAADFEAAIAAWNAVGGMRAMFRVAYGAATCSVRINLRNEVGYVDPRYIDGARGMTRTVYARGCRPPEEAGDVAERRVIVEADVLLSAAASMQTGIPESCVDLYPRVRRPVALHELGHALGLLHYDEQVTHMNTSAMPARYCGPRAYEPHPDDRAGGRHLYPAPGHAHRDVAASPFKLDGPNNVVRVMRGEEENWVCPGQVIDAFWSAANLGTEDTVTDVFFYISDNDIISSQDRLAGAVRDVRVPVGRFITERKPIRVPPDLPPGGPYYLGFVVDATSDAWELPASNNSTYTDYTLFVRSPRAWQCR
ncbi:MAG: hypothetical protein H6703_14390 [Myxococcales bacterium]|nr:hypothetical protein [Myxococcales bacterium]